MYVGIFRGERDGGAYAIEALNKTYRSSHAVVEAVNRVFVRGRLRGEFPGWEAAEHVSANGEDMPGFVQAVTAPGMLPEDLFEPVFCALQAVDPVRRAISAAVLVRANTIGEQIAAYLKSRAASKGRGARHPLQALQASREGGLLGSEDCVCARHMRTPAGQ